MSPLLSRPAMPWRRNIADQSVGILSRLVRSCNQPPERPKSILVLRSNDLGDLLIVTPLFAALSRRYPEAQIVAGIGSWNIDTLKLNPYVSEVIAIDTPWHNKFVRDQSTVQRMRYLLSSNVIQSLSQHRFDIGIDVLGSNLGSLLMLRLGIPHRLGVRGFGGGHLAVQQFIDYDPFEQVGRSALRFAELLGAKELPECRPQIFLSEAEQLEGEKRWQQQETEAPTERILIAPGGGFAEKCWAGENFVKLIHLLMAEGGRQVIVVGGKQDRALGAAIVCAVPGVLNLAGDLELRQTFALIAAADTIFCNSSMVMHAAAAFRKQTFVLLGEGIDSARQHAAQWGYPHTCHVLGKDEDRDLLYTPDEVIAYLKNVDRNGQL